MVSWGLWSWGPKAPLVPPDDPETSVEGVFVLTCLCPSAGQKHVLEKGVPSPSPRAPGTAGRSGSTAAGQNRVLESRPLRALVDPPQNLGGKGDLDLGLLAEGQDSGCFGGLGSWTHGPPLDPPQDPGAGDKPRH